MRCSKVGPSLAKYDNGLTVLRMRSVQGPEEPGDDSGNTLLRETAWTEGIDSEKQSMRD